ncbi:MAG TPA: nuclear transport factor 2 family protein [Candidatus Acidoferrales bacterium]
MRYLVATVLFVSMLTVSSPAFASPKAAQPTNDVKFRIQRLFEVWQALDPAKAAPFYAKDADLVFYDIAPLKYTGWAEYAEGVKKAFADFASAKFTLGNDLRVSRLENLAWATATWHGELMRRDGTKAALDGRWTGVLEKHGREWLIVHEHMSVPLPPAPSTAGR